MAPPIILSPDGVPTPIRNTDRSENRKLCFSVLDRPAVKNPDNQDDVVYC